MYIQCVMLCNLEHVKILSKVKIIPINNFSGHSLVYVQSPPHECVFLESLSQSALAVFSQQFHQFLTRESVVCRETGALASSQWWTGPAGNPIVSAAARTYSRWQLHG